MPQHFGSTSELEWADSSADSRVYPHFSLNDRRFDYFEIGNLDYPRRFRQALERSIIWFRTSVMEPAINRLEFLSRMMAPTREEL